MPTTRRPITRSARSHVTPEATALFEAALEIEACDDHKFWERDGGKRAKYIDVWNQLQHALGLEPYQPSPLDVHGEPPAWDGHPDYWRRSVELRAAVIGSTQGRWVENG